MALMKECKVCGEFHPIEDYTEEGWQRQVCKKCEAKFEQDAATPKTKVCECCGRELPIASFTPNKKFKDGYNPKCVECIEFLKSDVEPKFKTCPKCGKTLPKYLFYKSKDSKDGLTSWCKTCSKKGAAANKEKNRNTPHPPIDSKICTRCGRFLPIEEFPKNRNTKDGYDSWCKDCKSETHSLYDQKRRMQKLNPNWTPPTQDGIDRSAESIPSCFEPTPFAPLPSPYPPTESAQETPNPIENGMPDRIGIFTIKTANEVIREAAEQDSWLERPPLSSPIEERRQWLKDSINRESAKYPTLMLSEFYLYWSELTPDGKKMRFELQPTWETWRRLDVWSKTRVSPPLPPIDNLEEVPLSDGLHPAHLPNNPEGKTAPSVMPNKPKDEQPEEQATYSPKTITIRFKEGDKVIRLKDGIFYFEQLSGNVSIKSGEGGIELLYETRSGDIVSDKALFKNKREALERTKLASIPEDKLTYGNKPIKQF